MQPVFPWTGDACIASHNLECFPRPLSLARWSNAKTSALAPIRPAVCPHGPGEMNDPPQGEAARWVPSSTLRTGLCLLSVQGRVPFTLPSGMFLADCLWIAATVLCVWDGCNERRASAHSARILRAHTIGDEVEPRYKDREDFVFYGNFWSCSALTHPHSLIELYDIHSFLTKFTL